MSFVVHPFEKEKLRSIVFATAVAKKKYALLQTHDYAIQDKINFLWFSTLNDF